MGSAILGVIFFSTGPALVAGAETGGITISFWRVLIGCGFVTFVVAVRGGLHLSILRQTAVAGVGFGAASALFFSAVQITSVANAVLITVLQPVPLVIAGRLFFGERVRAHEVLWILVALGGAAAMVVAGAVDGTGDIRGDILAVAAMLMTSVYFIAAKGARSTLETLPFLAGLWFWATITLIPILIIFGDSAIPVSNTEWLKILGVTALPGIGHFLTSFSHARTSLAVVGVLQLFIPVGASLLAWWFLGQSITGWRLLGMAVVIVSLTIYTIVRSRESVESPSTNPEAASG